MKKFILAVAIGTAIFVGTGIVSGNQGAVPTPAVVDNLAYDTGAAWRSWLELMNATGETTGKPSAGKLARVWPECNQIPHCKETSKTRCYVTVTCYGRWSGERLGSFVTRAPDAPSDCKAPDKAWSQDWPWNSLGRCPESHAKWKVD